MNRMETEDIRWYTYEWFDMNMNASVHNCMDDREIAQCEYGWGGAGDWVWVHSAVGILNARRMHWEGGLSLITQNADKVKQSYR